MRPLAGTLALAALVLGASTAHASYTPPLTRVRIDRSIAAHTPSLFWASDEKNAAVGSSKLSLYGVQYILQEEWPVGFGFQLTASVARSQLEAAVSGGTPWSYGPSVEGTGYFGGGQLRAYYMLWSGNFTDAPGRPHALTAFINVRGTYYHASGDPPGYGGFSASSSAISGGLGLMAEFALLPWLSLCPYAWFSPGLSSTTTYDLGTAHFEDTQSLSLRQPVRAGIDLWWYVLGEASDSHLSLSFISSLFDTEDRGSLETSVVLGYTFSA